VLAKGVAATSRGDELAELKVAHELVLDDLDPDQLANGEALARVHAHHVGERREDVAEEELKRHALDADHCKPPP